MTISLSTTHSHSICLVHNRGRQFGDKAGIHYVLSLSPLTCENSLALSHEGRVLSEKWIIKVCDNLCHGWLSQRGTAVRLGPNPWQSRITGQTYDSNDRSTAIRPAEAAGSAIIQYVLQKTKKKGNMLLSLQCTLARGEIWCHFICGNWIRMYKLGIKSIQYWSV